MATVAQPAVTDTQGMNYLVSVPRRIVTIWLPLTVFLIVLLFPFYWMVITAFKPKAHRTLKVRLFGCPGQAPGYTCAELDCQGEGCKVCAANGECVSVTQIDPNDLPVTPMQDEDAGAGGPLIACAACAHLSLPLPAKRGEVDGESPA